MVAGVFARCLHSSINLAMSTCEDSPVGDAPDKSDRITGGPDRGDVYADGQKGTTFQSILVIRSHECRIVFTSWIEDKAGAGFNDT